MAFPSQMVVFTFGQHSSDQPLVRSLTDRPGSELGRPGPDAANKQHATDHLTKRSIARDAPALTSAGGFQEEHQDHGQTHP